MSAFRRCSCTARAEVSAGALEQLDAARMTKRMRVDGVHADAPAEFSMILQTR